MGRAGLGHTLSTGARRHLGGAGQEGPQPAPTQAAAGRKGLQQQQAVFYKGETVHKECGTSIVIDWAPSRLFRLFLFNTHIQRTRTRTRTQGLVSGLGCELSGCGLLPLKGACGGGGRGVEVCCVVEGGAAIAGGGAGGGCTGVGAGAGADAGGLWGYKKAGLKCISPGDSVRLQAHAHTHTRTHLPRMSTHAHTHTHTHLTPTPRPHPTPRSPHPHPPPRRDRSHHGTGSGLRPGQQRRRAAGQQGACVCGGGTRGAETFVCTCVCFREHMGRRHACVCSKYRGKRGGTSVSTRSLPPPFAPPLPPHHPSLPPHRPPLPTTLPRFPPPFPSLPPLPLPPSRGRWWACWCRRPPVAAAAAAAAGAATRCRWTRCGGWWRRSCRTAVRYGRRWESQWRRRRWVSCVCFRYAEDGF